MKKNLSSFFSRTVNGAKKLPKKTQLLFVIGTLFTASCSSELELTQDAMTIERTSSIKTVSSKDAINLLKNQTPTTKSMFKNVESTSSLNFVYQEKITNSDQMLTIIPNNENKNSKYVFLNINGKIETSIITTFPENTNTDSEFTGKIIIQRLDGSFVNGFRLKNGIIISRLEKKPTSKLTSNNTDPDPIELLEVIIPPKQKQYFSIVFIYYPYRDRANRGDLPESLMWDPTGGGGYIGDEPATEGSIAQAIEDQIDNSKLDPCPKAIMDQLKNTTNSDITKILTKIGANSIYTLDMVMGPTKQGYAQTQKISQNNYVITVANDRYTNSTQLFRAASLVHEIIHTYYLSVVDDNNSPSTNLSLNNFSALYQAYEQKKYPGGVTVAQHDQMVKDYVDSMALALQEYYLNNNTTPYSIPSYEVFSDLAWGTLQEASIFQEKFKDGDPAKERILNRYSCESNGQSIATGTPKQQNPIGKPCN